MARDPPTHAQLQELGISLATDEHNPAGQERPLSRMSYPESVDMTQNLDWMSSHESIQSPVRVMLEDVSQRLDHDDMAGDRTAHAWESTSTLPLDDDDDADEKASLDMGLGDVFDTYHLSRDSIHGDTSRSADTSAGWRAYLPVEEPGTLSLDEDAPPADEENGPTEKSSVSPFQRLFRHLRDSSTVTLERARRRREQRRERAPRKDSYPMRNAGEQSSEDSESRKPPPLPIYARLRGKSLMLFGPRHPWRVFLAKVLSSWWVEPLILVFIFINLVVLVVSSSRDVKLAPRTENLSLIHI